MCKCLGKRRIVIMGSWNHIELYPHIACEKVFKEKEQKSSFCEELVKTLLSINSTQLNGWRSSSISGKHAPSPWTKEGQCYLVSQSSDSIKTML